MVNRALRQVRDEDPHDLSVLRRLGELLARAQDEQHLSDRELAKLSGISRQHVRFATSGGNITIVKLLMLTRALQIPPRALTDLSLHVLVAARHIEEASSQLSEAVDVLKGHAPGQLAAQAKDDTDAQAAALVGEVMAKAKTLGRDGLGVLDETLRELVASAEQTNVSAGQVRPRGKGWRRNK
jgi:transcriptional regulator with XRE-family HTH domain